MMVAPISRSTIFTGKTLGGMTGSLIQGAILLLVGSLIGVPYTLLSVVQSISIILLLSFILTSLGLTIGSLVYSLEGFQLIASFVMFPLDNLPAWLSALTSIDPAIYSIDAMRHVILGVGSKPLELDISVLALFSVLLGAAGTIIPHPSVE